MTYKGVEIKKERNVLISAFKEIAAQKGYPQVLNQDDVKLYKPKGKGYHKIDKFDLDYVAKMASDYIFYNHKLTFNKQPIETLEFAFDVWECRFKEEIERNKKEEIKQKKYEEFLERKWKANMPTIEMFDKIIKLCGYEFSAKEAFDFFKKQGFRTKNDKPIVDWKRWLGYYNDRYKRNQGKKDIVNNELKRLANSNDVVLNEKPESYNEQLQDKRWLAFRYFILAIRGCKCEECGSTNNLQIHHPIYKNGAMAWEYTCNDVVVLCEKCHKKAHGLY